MIGRKDEQRRLLAAHASEYSEFVAVYGRRRVGKTFLIRESFNYRFSFQHSGVKNGGRAIQLARFRKSLMAQGYADCPPLKDWYSAFDALREQIGRSKDDRKVIFLDELPWLGRKDRHFVTAI